MPEFCFCFPTKLSRFCLLNEYNGSVRDSNPLSNCFKQYDTAIIQRKVVEREPFKKFQLTQIRLFQIYFSSIRKYFGEMLVAITWLVRLRTSCTRHSLAYGINVAILMVECLQLSRILRLCQGVNLRD